MGMFPTQDLPLQPMPTLASLSVSLPSETLEIEEHVSASGVLVIDVASGQRLFSSEENKRRPMASLTKIMTALLVVENHDLNERVRIPRGVEDTIGNKVYLEEGKHFSVGDLLSALLISSANDAAKALAIYHSGSLSAFTEEMNARVKELGLKNTSFSDPIGLDNPDQFSTAQDIAWITMFVQRYEPIAVRMRKRGMRIFSKEGDEIFLAHTHALMHAEKDVTGGKTGTTNGAGQCLVSLVEEEGTEYLVVIMNSLQRYKDMRAILEVLRGQPLV